MSSWAKKFLWALTAAILAAFSFSKPIFAERGCCSWHGGVCGCDTSVGRQVCCDGTYSPTCRCAYNPAPSPTTYNPPIQPVNPTNTPRPPVLTATPSSIPTVTPMPTSTPTSSPTPLPTSLPTPTLNPKQSLTPTGVVLGEKKEPPFSGMMIFMTLLSALSAAGFWWFLIKNKVEGKLRLFLFLAFGFGSLFAALLFLPFIIGSLLMWLGYTKISKPKIKYSFIAIITILTILTGTPYVMAMFSSPTEGEQVKGISDLVSPVTIEEKEVEEVSPTFHPSLNPTTQLSPLSQPYETTVPKATSFQPAPSPTPSTSSYSFTIKGSQRQVVKVTRVIDGDTIEIEGGQRVRYVGIDTPETVHPSKPVECFGREASDKNRELVEGKTVEMEKDISETDKYGRLLRYVFVGGIFVNEYLVRQGYAQSSTYPPDVKYQDLFLEAQREARENNRGLWGTCGYFGEAAVQPTSAPIPASQTSPFESTQPPLQNTGSYTCDCSKTCTQISSCDEAYFQLNQCGCSRRDGDSDDVPCENICPGG